MVYEVGKYYNIECAKIQFNVLPLFGTKRAHVVEYIPIIGVKHADPQFGTKLEHYHIDGRFMWRHATFKLDDQGRTNFAVFIGTPEYNVIGIVKRIRKCKRLTTGLKLYSHSNKQLLPLKYIKWADTYIGKPIIKGRCPHRGTEMLLENGKLRCALHDLHGCPVTKKIIRHPLQKQVSIFENTPFEPANEFIPKSPK